MLLPLQLKLLLPNPSAELTAAPLLLVVVAAAGVDPEAGVTLFELVVVAAVAEGAPNPLTGTIVFCSREKHSEVCEYVL